MIINKLSIIVPVYNEEKTIEEILTRLENLKFEEIKKEFVIVDDGSTDGTKSKLKSFSPSFKIIYHSQNQGKGAAIRTALNYVSGDYIIIQDADLEYDPQDIKKLVKYAIKKQALVVYGSRFLGNSARMRMPSSFLGRGGALLATLTNILYGTNLTDEATGYKLFKTSLLKNLNLEYDGFEFCPEVTAKIAKNGIKIHEVPISYKRRSEKDGKKLRFFPDAPKAVLVLLSQRFTNDEKNHFNFLDKLIREQRLKQIIPYLPKRNNLLWCDIGCGEDVHLLRRFQERIKKGVGIDPLVNSYTFDNITFIKKKIKDKIPLDSGQFNVVTLMAFLEHLEYPEIILKEAWRILKKDGVLILTTPNPKAKKILEFLASLKIISEREIKDHKNYFSPDNLKTILENVGFRSNNIILKKFQFGLNTLVSAKKNA